MVRRSSNRCVARLGSRNRGRLAFGVPPPKKLIVEMTALKLVEDESFFHHQPPKGVPASGGACAGCTDSPDRLKAELQTPAARRSGTQGVLQIAWRLSLNLGQPSARPCQNDVAYATRFWPPGSWSQCIRKNERRLSMNPWKAPGGGYQNGVANATNFGPNGSGSQGASTGGRRGFP